MVIRDGSGSVQGVLSKKEVPEATWAAFGTLTQETSVALTGMVREEPRSPGGYELAVTGLEILGPSHDYPITPKEHGTTFLFEHRHLWLRTRRQAAIARVRHEVEQAIRDFFYQEGFTLVDTPDPDRRHRGGGRESVRDRLLRPRQGLPGADRPALRRGRCRRAGQGLLLRPHLPRREVEDPPPPDRILDGGARGRVQRLGRQHAAAGGVRDLHRGPGAGAAARGAQGAGARHRPAGAGHRAVSRGSPTPTRSRGSTSSAPTSPGAPTSGATTRRCWRRSTTGRSSSTTTPGR